MLNDRRLDSRINFALAASLLVSSVAALAPEIRVVNPLSSKTSDKALSTALKDRGNPSLILEYKKAHAQEEGTSNEEAVAAGSEASTNCSTVFDLRAPVTVEGAAPNVPRGVNLKSLTNRVFQIPNGATVKVEARFLGLKQDVSNPEFQRATWTIGNGKYGPEMVRNYVGNNVNETYLSQATGFNAPSKVMGFEDYIPVTYRDVAMVIDSDGFSGMIGVKWAEVEGEIVMKPFRNPVSLYANGRQLGSGITSQENTVTTGEKLKIEVCSATPAA